MADQFPQGVPSARPARGLSALDAELRAPLLMASVGIAAGAGLAVYVPAPWNAAVTALTLGGAVLGAILTLDRTRQAQATALARSVGELNVRLAATRIRLDGLQTRLDSEPIREADFAPTRNALAELTAEVGLLGGVLRDVATSVADHETKLQKALAEKPAPEPVRPEPPAPANALTATAEASRRNRELRAESAAKVDAEMRRKEDEQAAAIVAAFEANGIELHLQPIVALPHRRTLGYEALCRLHMGDGVTLTPAEFLPALERAGQAANLDAQVLTRALAIASHLNSRDGDQFLSINLSNLTWGDTRTLHAVARILETYRASAIRIVLDVPQRIFRMLDPARLGVIGAIKAAGVRFALDHLSDLRVDPLLLADRGVAFVKAPASLLGEPGEKAAGLDVVVADLGHLLRRHGIELIGERAETDRLVADLIEMDVRLAQGFAISPPRPVRQEVFQAADSRPNRQAGPLAAPVTPPPEEKPAPQRVPFRSVLRRASA